MTEAEWLTCVTPESMLDDLRRRERASSRKQRLLDCACVRRIWHLLTDEDGRKAVELAEWYADSGTNLDELREAQAKTLAAADAQGTLNPPGTTNSFTVLYAAAGAAWEYRRGVDPLRHAAEALAWQGLDPNNPAERRLAKLRCADERRVQVDLLRDVFGNPFRAATVNPDWITPNVVALAETIYNERAFDRLPTLADLLADIGCDNQDILSHCRNSGPHVRGCWIVDLLLGKE